MPGYGAPAAVYPRVCGGTVAGQPPPGYARGLSPRVRGNLKRTSPVNRRPGSIPACAGEPIAGIIILRASRVYPRVCGGTEHRYAASHHLYGLSPRVRGNLRRQLLIRTTAGSIPACAGEPFSPHCRAAQAGVYPRVCGGTGRPCGIRIPPAGLSPRVRGNPTPAKMPRPALRSIPACAGEPGAPLRRRGGAEVYPRVCGGTRGAVGAPAPR